MTDVSILDPPVKAAPKAYTIRGAQEVVVKGVTASFDGTSAAGPFVPAVQIIDPAGIVIGTYVLGQTLAAGASADVSWFPGVGISTPSTVISHSTFAPAGNKVQVTSTDPDNPTDVFPFPAQTFDGITTIKLEFYASAADCDSRGDAFNKGNEAGLLLELWRDSTALGVISDVNATQGCYFISTCYVATLDTPPAGSATYKIRGFLSKSAGTPNFGVAFVYGTGIQTPHATRAGFGEISRVG